MKYTFILLMILLLGSCGGSLSDEQKKKIKDEMKASQIKKVSEADITEAALNKGRMVVRMINNLQGDSSRIDSLQNSEKVKVQWVVPGAKNILPIQSEMIEAYLAAGGEEQSDHVQKLRSPDGDSDSLLYTKPVMEKQFDGQLHLAGVWNIWLSRKQLVLSME